MPELSVVILCYKAGDDVPRFLKRVETAIEPLTKNYEIVLVGNYQEGDDEDRTPAVVRAEAAQDPRVRAVVKPKEGMMGWDARSGLDAATGDVIVLIDGDHQMPPEDVARVYEKLKADNLDMAMTRRISRGDGWKRKINSWCFNLIFSALFPGLGVKDVNSKPKALTRQLFDKMDLESDGWFIDAEILIQARRFGVRPGQIPTDFHEQENRRSFVKPVAVLEFIRDLAIWRVREWFPTKKA